MSLELTSDNLPSSEPSATPPNKSEAGFLSSDLNHFDPKIRRFLESSIAASTRRAYHGDVGHFIAWGGSVPASPETIARYLADNAGTLSVATLSRRLAAIGRAHVLEGLSNPATTDLVRIVRRGIRRIHGRPQERVAALTKEHLVAIASSLGTSTRDVRDRALLLIGFAGAFRRSELIAIDCSSVKRSSQGISIRVCKSKTDQESRGREIAIPRLSGPTCPVQALDAWLDLAKISEGPVFCPVTTNGSVLPRRLSSEAVALIVKQRSKSVGLQAARYSGHSLRAGFVTSAAIAGVPIWKIKAQTGHASEAALSRYIRNCELFAESPVSLIL